MQVEYDKAVGVFGRLSEALRAPSLHPYYVAADARRNAELKPVYFLYEEGRDVYYHGFHVAPVQGTDFYDIQSPYGYGGPVASCNNELFLTRAWGAYLQWCRKQNILAEFIRFHPLLENWRYYKGNVIEDRQTIWIDLGAQDILMTYSARARTSVRKAMKSGLLVAWDSEKRLAGAFSELYRSTMSTLQADAFYYFNEEYFNQLLTWDKAHLVVCFSEDDIIAASIFLADSNFMEYHLSANTDRGKELSANNLILHEATQFGKKLGCRYLHLGGGTDARVDNPLFFFKTGFSKCRGIFKIGKLVHQETVYNRLRADWLMKHAELPKRVLFYRTN